MAIDFSGCWDIKVTAREPDTVDDESAKKLIIEGADTGNGTYDPQVGISLEVSGDHWTLTILNQNPLGTWVPSPVQVINTQEGMQIGANDEESANGPFDDLVLRCTPCRFSVGRLRDQAAINNWVSWGVKVDGGGPTGHGPVPPWTPHLRALAAGLALADAAHFVNADLRAGVLATAAKQVDEAAAAISKAMRCAPAK